MEQEKKDLMRNFEKEKKELIEKADQEKQKLRLFCKGIEELAKSQEKVIEVANKLTQNAEDLGKVTDIIKRKIDESSHSNITATQVLHKANDGMHSAQAIASEFSDEPGDSFVILSNSGPDEEYVREIDDAAMPANSMFHIEIQSCVRSETQVKKS